MYLRTPSLHQPGSFWPTQAGTAVSKDIWMLGIGLGLLVAQRSPRSKWSSRHDRVARSTGDLRGQYGRVAGRAVTGRRAGALTLGDVAPADWDSVTPAGTDAVWLMGVWERSPAGLAVANANAELQQSFRQALPDVRPERHHRLAVLRPALRGR